jgi:hypothetical protein
VLALQQPQFQLIAAAVALEVILLDGLLQQTQSQLELVALELQLLEMQQMATVHNMEWSLLAVVLAVSLRKE